MKFFKKIENNKGADLQLMVVVLMLIFLFAIFMAMDFWMASSAKIILIKETQAAEVYCLVKTIEGNYDALRMFEDAETANLGTYQSQAIERFGRQGGTNLNTMQGEIYERFRTVAYLNDFKVEKVSGIQPAIGQMGIAMKMTYHTKTIVRSPQDIIGWISSYNKDIKTTANRPISLSVTAKVVPMTWDK